MASSEDFTELYHHHQPDNSVTFPADESNIMNLQMFDPNNWYLMSCFNGSIDDHINSCHGDTYPSVVVKEAVGGGAGETPPTPNSSSISDQDSDKGKKEVDKDTDNSSKKEYVVMLLI